MSGILTGEMLANIRQLDDECKMYDILTYLDGGVKKGWYTQEALDNDLEAMLWMAYAFINMDTFQTYRLSERCLKQVEEQGARNGTWCYRLSVTLMYLGKYQASLDYARQCTATDPAYPWGWLQLARISYQAGLIEQALSAVESGLLLVPGDYEFTTTRKEIEQRCDFSKMLGHCIDPQADMECAADDRIGRLASERQRIDNKGAKSKYGGN